VIRKGLPKDIPRRRFWRLGDTGGSLPGNPAKIQVLEWLTESKSFKVDSPGPAQITLRLWAYPAWGSEIEWIDNSPAAAKRENGPRSFSLSLPVSVLCQVPDSNEPGPVVLGLLCRLETCVSAGPLWLLLWAAREM